METLHNKKTVIGNMSPTLRLKTASDSKGGETWMATAYEVEAVKRMGERERQVWRMCMRLLPWRETVQGIEESLGEKDEKIIGNVNVGEEK